MKALFFLFLFSPFVVNAQIITTYVDTSGIEGYTGDGGTALSAEIGRPLGMNLDDSGNLVVGTAGVEDFFRKINAITGIITTIAFSDTASSAGEGGDGGPALCAGTLGPYDVCYDAAGNFYIADRWYSEVRKVTIATGIIDTFAGNRTIGNSGDGGPAKSAELNSPISICFDPAQHYLYISNQFGHTVRKVDMLTNIIYAFAGTGVSGYSGDDGLAIAATFGMVLGICNDNNGNIYIGDYGNHRIRKVNAATGIVTTIAGIGIDGYSGDGGPAISAMIYEPFALCFDKCGNLFFSDSNRVRRIDGITGIITTVAGNGIGGYSGDGGLAINAQLNVAYGIVIDTFGNLYISDLYNNRIRKTTYPNPFIKISISPNDTICSGFPVTIQSALAGGGSTPTFQWVVNGTPLGGTTSSTYTYVPSNGDSISCILTSSSECVGNPNATSNTIHLTVTPSFTPTITITSSATALVGSTVTVNATVAGAGSVYNINWYNNGVLFNTSTMPTVTYTKAASTDHITATVIPSPIGIFPGCYDSTTSSAFTIAATVGVSAIIAKPLHIYPNPADVILHIDNVSIQAGYRLLSIVGSVLQQGMLQPGNNNISIQALSPGIYMLEITTLSFTEGRGEVKTITKFIKQ